MKKYHLYLLLLLAFAACKPLPDNLKLRAQLTKSSLDNKVQEIKDKEIMYDTIIKNNEYLLKPTLTEKLKSNFGTARDILKGCSENRKKIDLYVEDDDNDDALHLESEISNIEAKLSKIDELITQPIYRATFFKQIYTDFEKYKHINDSLMVNLEDSLRSATRFSKITIIKYPGKKESIGSQLLQIELNVKSNHSVRDSFLVQYNLRKNIQKHNEDFDLKKFADNYNLFVNNRYLILNNIKAFKDKLSELDLSYTRILDDSDADFYVTIARTSWDESSDMTTDQDYIYTKIEVSESVFEYIDQLDDNAVIAEYKTSWGGDLSVHIADSIWKMFNINAKESWPSDYHDYSEFWIQSADVVYYHKYMIEKNGKLDSTDFVVVSEADYYKYEDADGLAIYAKSIGNYNSEADTIPSTPGMAHVGNLQYGEWRDSTSHHSCHGGAGAYWYFYRPYYYYNTWGGTYSYHHYSDYTTTYRNRSTYYGGINREQHYRNYSTRRGRSTTSSYRNGRSYRGGGPGGGGK